MRAAPSRVAVVLAPVPRGARAGWATRAGCRAAKESQKIETANEADSGGRHRDGRWDHRSEEDIDGRRDQGGGGGTDEPGEERDTERDDQPEERCTERPECDPSKDGRTVAGDDQRRCRPDQGHQAGENRRLVDEALQRAQQIQAGGRQFDAGSRQLGKDRLEIRIGGHERTSEGLAEDRAVDHDRLDIAFESRIGECRRSLSVRGPGPRGCRGPAMLRPRASGSAPRRHPAALPRGSRRVATRARI